MCGFVGAVTRDSGVRRKLGPVLADVGHRGPNSSGFIAFHTDGIFYCLGFNRLAIQDLSHDADQPFTKTGWTLLFNGEIYNKGELAEILQRDHGVVLRTRSDTEVVLEAFRCFGQYAPERMTGMFALAAFEHRTRTTYMCRDRLGIKPFYLREAPHELFFASDVRSLHQLTGPLPLDISFFERNVLLDPFVGYGNRTPFCGITALEPGELRVYQDTELVSSRTYYDIKDVRQGQRSVTPASLENLFDTVVGDHLIGDVPVACALSGGFDSSIISRTAFRFGRNYHCFSLKLDDGPVAPDSDPYFATLLYRSLAEDQSKHHFVGNTEPWSLDLIDRFVKCLGSPIYDERVLVWHNLYRAVHETGLKVLLNGQGADELWHGYYPMRWNWFSALYHTDMSHAAFLNYFSQRLKESAVYPLVAGRGEAVLDELVADCHARFEAASVDTDAMKKLSCFMVKTVLRSLLHFEDALSMLHGVEVRVPFVDHRLVEVALSLTPEQHLREKKLGKDYLKEVLGDRLPAELVARRKEPLPKPRPGDPAVVALIREHMGSIRCSPLVQALYDVNALGALARDGAAPGFYGGTTEALLQVLSTWRFEEVFRA